MTKKTTEWHVMGRRVLLRAVKKQNPSGIILIKSVSDKARDMYTYYIEETGEDVPSELKKGCEVYVSLPGISFIEGTTDEKDEETFFFTDYNFIYLYKK